MLGESRCVPIIDRRLNIILFMLLWKSGLTKYKYYVQNVNPANCER